MVEKMAVWKAECLVWMTVGMRVATRAAWKELPMAGLKDPLLVDCWADSTENWRAG
jgi:hypothetical protein